MTITQKEIIMPDIKKDSIDWIEIFDISGIIPAEIFISEEKIAW